jgi:hypothetical protein
MIYIIAVAAPDTGPLAFGIGPLRISTIVVSALWEQNARIARLLVR